MRIEELDDRRIGHELSTEFVRDEAYYAKATGPQCGAVRMSPKVG